LGQASQPVSRGTGPGKKHLGGNEYSLKPPSELVDEEKTLGNPGHLSRSRRVTRRRRVGLGLPDSRLGKTNCEKGQGELEVNFGGRCRWGGNLVLIKNTKKGKTGQAREQQDAN